MPTLQSGETPEQLISRLCDGPFSRAWWHAIEHLAWFGTAAVPALITALGSDSEPVRSAAAQALGRIGPKARQATRPLLNCLFDPAIDVRLNAASALDQIAPPLKAALPVLIGRLNAEENKTVQSRLLRVVGNIGPAAHPALALIYPRLNDPYFFPNAVYAIRSIDPEDAQLLRVVYEQLCTPQASFRALAAETAGKLRLRSPEWVNALVLASLSRDTQTRHAARNALCKIQK